MSDTTDRFRRMSELFDHAAMLAGAERARFIGSLQGADAELRGELEAMLAADSAPGVLDRNLEDLAARVGSAAAANALIGRQIGNWRIVDIVGRGGMGAVYRAERADGAYLQNAALKLIQFGVDSPEMRGRFLRERQFLASLQHPNIATLLDGGVSADGTPYLAMEFVDGRRIDEYCDANRLTIAQRLQLMQQVLAAVQHAHQRLIVHRDLKPSNVLVSADGTAKLLDFGIATVLDASGVAAATRERPYTPGYAAPEQLAGQPVTTATDVYALGVILLRLLGGVSEAAIAARERAGKPDDTSRPLLQATAGPDAPAIASARATQPRALVRLLRGDLDTIVQRALAADPLRRYPSAQALATDIGLWLGGRPILARPDSWLYRARTFVRRHRIAVALAALALLALVAATVFSVEQAAAARAAARDAEARALSLRAVSDTFDHQLHVENFLADANGAPSAARLLRDNLPAIDYFLADQPLTRASLLWRSGRALRVGGEPREAVAILRKATAAFDKAGAGTTLNARDANVELARALIDSGDTDGALAALAALERSLRPDEVNVDLQHHAIALLRARVLLAAGKLDDARVQVEAALALAPTPSGEHGARYGTTALLAGTIALARGDVGAAADRCAEALEAMAADPHADLAPPHQPLAPVIETLARVGDGEGARAYAARWQALRERYFGATSAQAREAAGLQTRLASGVQGAADDPRAARLRRAFASYWAATFVNYDVTREQQPLSLDRDL